MTQLAGCYIKVERAKKHVHDLIAELHAWRARNPYRVTTKKDSHTGDIVHRLSIHEDIPTGWSAIIGDAVHNLRAALDLLACTFIRANGAQIRIRSGFPISKSQKEFEAEAMAKLEGASDEARSFIHQMKPYKDGDNALWQIHQLDILDKHKTIVPVGSAYRHFTPLPNMKVPWQEELVRFPGINIPPQDSRRYPINDGDILLRVKEAAQPDEGATDYQFKFELVFGKTDVTDGEPIIPMLQQYGQLIEKIIIDAERKFFS